MDGDEAYGAYGRLVEGVLEEISSLGMLMSFRLNVDFTHNGTTLQRRLGSLGLTTVEVLHPKGPDTRMVVKNRVSIACMDTVDRISVVRLFSIAVSLLCLYIHA